MQRKFDGRLARIRVDDMRHSTEEWRGLPVRDGRATDRVTFVPIVRDCVLLF